MASRFGIRNALAVAFAAVVGLFGADAYGILCAIPEGSWEEAFIDVETVSIDGVPLDDLGAYRVGQVTLVADSPFLHLEVRSTDGDLLFSQSYRPIDVAR